MYILVLGVLCPKETQQIQGIILMLCMNLKYWYTEKNVGILRNLLYKEIILLVIRQCRSDIMNLEKLRS